MLETPTAEVPAEAAYAAATNRALMTTNALILAEAQLLCLRKELAEANRRANHAEKQAEVLKTRMRSLKYRAEGVTHDAANDEATDARCEADPSHDFSD